MGIMALLGPVIFAVIAVVLLVVFTTVLITMFLAIVSAMFSGAVGAPAALFSFLIAFFSVFTVHHHLLVKVLVFVVCYLGIKTMMQYKKLKYAVATVIAVLNSALCFMLLDAFLSIFNSLFISSFEIHGIVWAILTTIMAFVLVLMAVTNDEGNGKVGNEIITRIIASLLYGMAFGALGERFLVPFIADYPTWLNGAMFIVFGIIAFIVDTVLSKNDVNLIDRVLHSEALRAVTAAFENLLAGAISVLKRFS